MVTVNMILDWIDEFAPFRYAASWDNSGLQVGDPDAAVERVLVALDVTTHSFSEALELRCECLVSHHPLIFQPLKSLRFDLHPGRLLAAAARHQMHLIAAHTNLDAARQGVNDRLAEVLQLIDTAPLQSDPCWRDEDQYRGLGLVGNLTTGETLEVMAKRLAAQCGTAGVRIVGDPDRRIHRVALCSGSGGSFIDAVIKTHCDVYVTGDLKYHEAQLAVEEGLALVDLGHFASEQLIIGPLANYLRSRAVRSSNSLTVHVCKQERDPFHAVTVGD